MRRLNAVTIVGLITVCVATTHIAVRLAQSSEHWWTPTELTVPFPNSRDRVVVLLNDQRLGEHLDAGTLRVAGPDGDMRPVTAEDVRFRFNNWDRVRAQRNAHLALSAALLAAGVMMALGGLVLVPKLPSAPAEAS